MVEGEEAPSLLIPTPAVASTERSITMYVICLPSLANGCKSPRETIIARVRVYSRMIKNRTVVMHQPIFVAVVAVDPVDAVGTVIFVVVGGSGGGSRSNY